MNRSEEVGRFVEGRISVLQGTSSYARAQIAVLRRGAGKPMNMSPDTWAVTLDGLPEDLLGKDLPDRFEPSPAENAIHVALTLFAVHVQGGKSDPHVPGLPFARSCRLMAETSGISQVSVRHRMDTMFASADIEELSVHARGLVQIMRDNRFGFDYSGFAADLYSYQFNEGRIRTMFKWGREFYASSGVRA